MPDEAIDRTPTFAEVDGVAVDQRVVAAEDRDHADPGVGDPVARDLQRRQCR